ncbi:hypothetical protein M758_10G147100 [Ceratodon purpureus]|uniref:Uncharacterized protein n=1 Tax=Ceratodon purpureus TaxID=3225 RepID=A0A8T0GSY5_CERPU|nr:hypothetical protein KC19_10G152500 [Ceratodon purpureus]KAG0604123.1 hypothetical protein M758_10G147100 [Ceratodon purpureus]
MHLVELVVCPFQWHTLGPVLIDRPVSYVVYVAGSKFTPSNSTPSSTGDSRGEEPHRSKLEAIQLPKSVLTELTISESTNTCGGLPHITMSDHIFFKLKTLGPNRQSA